MGTKKSTIPEGKLALYDRLIATQSGIERKGATMPYTSLNGHMFSFLKDGVLNLRLPSEAREAFLKRYDVGLSVQYGVVMEEYVTVPDALLKDTKTLKRYLQLSCDYIRKLKPKPTKPKK